MAQSIVTLRVEARNAISSLNKTSQATKILSRNANGATKSLAAASTAAKGLGASLATSLAPLFTVTAAVATVSNAIGTFQARERDVAILTQGLQNLGAGAAQLNELQEAADRLGNQTLFNQEEFTRGFNLLTSFRNIGVDSYSRVAQAAADIAQVNQVDVSTSFMQLAKALQDPERNLSNLNRSGIAFTKQQTEVIKQLMKTNKTAEAHAMILSIVEESYNGLAQAAAVGFAGEVDTLGESFRDFSETLGKALEPTLIAATRGLTTLLNVLDNFLKSPFASFVSDTLQAAFKGLVATGQQFVLVMKEAFGAEATVALEKLKNGFISVGKIIKHVAQDAEFIGRVIGGVIGVSIRNLVTLRQQIRDVFIKSTQPVVNFFEGISKSISQTTKNLVQGFRQAFQKLIDLIPEPVKQLLGEIQIPTLNLDIALPKFEDPFKKLKQGVDAFIPAVIEYSEVERTITDENNKQLDAKNKIVSTVPKIKKEVEKLTEAQKKAKEEADKLKEKFMEIGKGIEQGIVSNLTNAVMGTQTLAQAAMNVLENLKRKLIEVAIQRAVSGIGNFFGGALGGIFGGLFANGGRPPVGKASIVGERGPEIFIPSVSGTVIPNNKIGGAGSVNNIVINVDASGSSVEGNESEGKQLGVALSAAIESELVKQKRPGGLLA